MIKTLRGSLLALGSLALWACGDDAGATRDDATAPDTTPTDTTAPDVADTTAPDVADTTAPDVADTTEPDSAADVAADSADTVDTTPATPRIRFFVRERPQDDDDVEVEATSARWGDRIRVVVDGLAPGAATTLAFISAAGQSQAIFAADADGVIDLARDAPVPDSGSDWSVANADAFTWSMHDIDVTAPFDPAIKVIAFLGDGQLTATFARHDLVQDIEVETVADGTTRGVFAHPPGPGPFGGVLCFGGSEGGTSTGERCADHLADLGYAALGIGYFGAEGLPAHLAEVPLEILERDLAWLTADPRVAAGGVVVMGGSRGGELSLILGARFPAVRGVVAQVPSGYVWGSSTGADAAWTYDGVALPFVPMPPEAMAQIAISSEGIRGFASRALFFDSITAATPDQLDVATTRIELVDGPVLLLGGEDDQLWPSCPMADVAYQRLVASGHAAAHDDRFICSPDAGHFATGMPGWSAVGSTAADLPQFGKLVVGGTVAGNGAAWRVNDTATRALLERVLGPGKIVAPSSRHD